MIHANKRAYKPISDLNSNFPSGFKTISFRLLPDRIKFQIISNKVSQMEKKDFTVICTLLNFTLDDIHDEKQQLEEYLNSLELKMKKNPNNIKRRTNKISQKEIDNLALRPNLFTLIEMIKKKHNIKELSNILSKNRKVVFNLQTILEKDVRNLNDMRKELALRNIEETNPALSQEHQSTIKKLITYNLSYVNEIYTPIIEKHRTRVNNANSKLEQFLFTVVDSINEKIEKIKDRCSLNIKEFYFDDNLELRIMVINKPPSKYPLKVLHFDDLETTQKRRIIQILRTVV